MTRPLWFVNLLKKTFPNVKLIARLTNFPILGKIIDELLFKGDDILYLPCDKVIQVNKKMSQPGEFVLPSQLLEHFVKKAHYHWIMDFCICRSSMGCNNYPQELGCLFLGKATIGINSQLGRMVSKEEALQHLQKCKEAGLVHMIGKNRLDKQWLGVSPGDQLMSICNCCPCCCLWRVSSIIHPKIGKKIKKMPGVEVSVDERCVGCGICTQGICFVNAIRLVKGRAVIGDECKGFGRCVSACPQGAIELTLNDPNYVKKSIKRMERIVDVE
ncbi:MAG: 4Fe-4S ferredoxin [Candidatus Lokiarchaeota archaeon]|nr:4Fe-4S ferredoxin [Candidatus Lokiarchaeota archaeon]